MKWDYAADVIRDALKDLLAEDGMLVPLLVLRGLTKLGTPVSGELTETIQQIARAHPSFGVRVQASAAVRNLHV